MEKIIIKDFGPIEYIDFSLEKSFNIIIGEQATGKSTLAKLIYFFKDIINDLESALIRQPERIKNNTANEILEKYYLNVRRKFIVSFGSYNLKENSQIIYYYENERKAILEISSGNLKFCYDKNTEIAIKNILDKSLILLNGKNNVEETLQQISFYAYLIDNLFENYKRRMFIPACRSRVMEFASTGISSFFGRRKSTDIYFDYMLNNITYFRFFAETFNRNNIYEVYRQNNNLVDDLKIRLDETNELKKRILKGEYKWDKKTIKILLVLIMNKIFQ